MQDMMDLIATSYAKTDLKPYLFALDQKLRLKKGRSDDGQTPRHWDGAIVTITFISCTGIFKDHLYRVQHENGAIDTFKENEIDMRYMKNKKL